MKYTDLPPSPVPVSLQRRALLRWLGLAPVAAAGSTGTAQPVASTAQEMSDRTQEVAAALQALPRGGRLKLRHGYTVVPAGIAIETDRIAVEGEGANVSTIILNGTQPGTAIGFNTANRAGATELAVRDVGFTSATAQPKIAVDLHNVSSAIVERLGMSEGSWKGAASIGIRTHGRELVDIRDCVIACARPLVLSPNPHWPSLANDHLRVARSLFITTAMGGACIECEDGAGLLSASFEKLALCGGRDGFRWKDGKAPIASFGLAFRDIRIEQGASAQGWSFDLQSAAGLQSVTFENCRLDLARNGIRLRNAQRITMINVECDTRTESPLTLLDIVGVPGTVLIMINCFAQTRGRITLRNMRRVIGLDSYVSETAFGSFEIWTYSEDVTPPLRIGESAQREFVRTLAPNAKLDLETGPGTGARLTRIDVEALDGTELLHGSAVAAASTVQATSAGVGFGTGDVAGQLCIIVESGRLKLINRRARPVLVMAHIRYA